MHFSYLDIIWQEGSELHFKTVVTPRRQVVEAAEIAQYKSDVEAMYNRSLNCFPYKVDEDLGESEVEPHLPWRETLGYLLFWCLLAGVWMFF